MISKNAKGFTLTLILFSGIVLGSFIGSYLAGLPYLGWLGFGETFSIGSPAELNLGILYFSFTFSLTINIAGILGIIIAFFAYRKLR